MPRPSRKISLPAAALAALLCASAPIEARQWVEAQMPLDLDLALAGDERPFAQYRWEPSVGIYLAPGMALGLRYYASKEQLNLFNDFSDPDTVVPASGRTYQLYKVTQRTSGFGIFLEWAVRPLTFGGIWTPIVGTALFGTTSTSDLKAFSAKRMDFVDKPEYESTATLQQARWSNLLGLEAAVHPNVALFYKASADWGWENLMAMHKGNWFGLRSRLGVSFRI